MNFDKNGGSIRVRKNGTTEYRVYIDGKVKSFYGKDEKTVKKKYRDYKKTHTTLDTCNSNNITLDEYIRHWLVTYKYGSISNSSYDRLDNTYENHIKNSNLSSMKVKDIRHVDIQNLINDKKAYLSVSSLKKIREVLYPTFEQGIIDGIIQENPAKRIILPKEKRRSEDIKVYTKDEISKISSCISSLYFIKNTKRYRYAPLFVFILNTGLRLGEALAIEWKDVNFDNSTLRINKGITIEYQRNEENKKTKKVQIVGDTKTFTSTRYIPLNEAAIFVLKEMKERNSLNNITSDIVFPSYKGDYLCIRSVQQTFKSICDDLGIEHKGIHALRHTFATLLLTKKIDIKVVSEILGHTDIRFTYNKYIHILQEQKAEAINLINITSDHENVHGYFMGTSEM